MITEQERKELQMQFENETETPVINTDGEFDIEYVIWLEEKVVKLFALVPVNASLQDRLFQLANDFAAAKQGEVAVKLHSIHNGLK